MPSHAVERDHQGAWTSPAAKPPDTKGNTPYGRRTATTSLVNQGEPHDRHHRAHRLIGHQVLRMFSTAASRSGVIVRDPSRLLAEVRERVKVVQGSHGDIDVVDQAFQGAGAVFWLVPPDFRKPTTSWPPTSTSPGRPATLSGAKGSSAWSESPPWVAGARWPRTPVGVGLVGDGRPDREDRRELPGADDALVHGQHPPAGAGDPGPAACSSRRSPGTKSCRPARIAT